MEKWKVITGYNNYAVSNYGRVKNVVIDKILKPDVTYDGYLRVTLWKEGKSKHFRIHRLVAEAFISNPNDYPSVNHKNEIKTDNCITNLEWCSIAYNNTYNGRAKRAGEKFKKPVKQLKNGLVIAVFNSVKEAAEALGINPNSISNTLTGRSKTAGGFKWEFS